MHRLSIVALAACAALAFGSVARAQQPPEYGPPIKQAQAMKVAAAAQAKAKEIGQRVIITIVDPAGHLVYFTKMDGAQNGSIAISIKKARCAALFRRPSKVFEDLLAKGGGFLSFLTLPGVIASGGGVPLKEDGKIVGAIGVSGSPNGTIDAQASDAGAAAM
jgi:glc operon protein GlcG